MSFAYSLVALFSAQLLVDLVFAGETTEPDLAVRTWPRQIGHAILHGAFAWLLLGDGAAWPLALLIALSHAIIDEFEARRAWSGLLPYTLGMTLHLVIAIGGLVLLMRLRNLPMDPIWLDLLGPWALRVMIVVAGAASAVFLGAQLVGWVVAPLRPQFEPRPDRTAGAPGDASDHPNRGFQEGGRLIGMLERALIFLLVLTGQSGGIGFLVAAKSIFRFGELRQRSNRLEAEYILIGTFASFLWGLLIASLTIFFLSRIR